MSEEQKIHVVIADDQELVRAGFAMVIGSQPDMAADQRVAASVRCRRHEIRSRPYQGDYFDDIRFG